MTDNPITNARCHQIIRLFDYCFKQGVLDASEVDDEFVTNDWLDARRENHDFGLLTDPDGKYDWQRWRFTLLRWCRLAGLRKLGEEFIDGIRNKRVFTYVIFPMSMRFYLLGVQEWLWYPNHANIEYFKHNGKIHWKDFEGSPYQKISTHDWIVYMQQFTYEAMDFDDAIGVPHSYWDGFTQAMWLGTRR